MTIDVESCRLIPTESHPGAENMALDEIAARRAADTGTATARVYCWEPSTLSLGYTQQPKTVAWKWCREHGIDVTRRSTGGGGILHESTGDVAYSIVAPSDAVPSDLLDAYELLCTPVIDAFASLGIEVDFASEEQPPIYEPSCYLRGINPAHDLVVAGTPERKISGNAQYRQRDAVVQHGSLKYAVDPDRLLNCFTTEDIDSDQVRERVATVEELGVTDLTDMIDALEGSLVAFLGAEPGNWTEAERAASKTLTTEKFEAEEWIRHREAPA